MARNHKVISRPAPIGGLNVRDSIANMPEGDAIQLINWIPDSYGVRCRKGYRVWAENFPSDLPIQSILPYFDMAATYPATGFLDNPTTMPGQLFAATKAGIYDITSATDAPVLDQALASATNSGWFSSVMFSNSAGNFMLACSEDDGYFKYDGTSWVKITLGAGANQVSVGDPTKFVHVSTWKRRAWFVEKDSTSVWYLATDAVTGAATELDLGSLMKNGGAVAFTANWTIDAGEGIDDFLVIVTTVGDVIIYKGSDPASASTFALVGVWSCGQVPVGRRGYAQFGGDLAIVSADGVFPVSHITRGGADQLQATGKEYSSKIRAAIGPDLRSSFTSRGWDMLIHPSERLLVISAPDTTSRRNFQYALSTTQNEWTTFSDIPAYCFGSIGSYSFAGTLDGRVLLLFSSYFDNVQYGESTGSGIYGTIQQAYSNFESAAMSKMFTMLRPVFLSAAPPGVIADIYVNYAVATNDVFPSYTASSLALWDVAIFDVTAWSSIGGTYGDWVSVGGVGYSGSAVLQTACVGDTVLSSIDYMYQGGGPL